MNQSSLIGTVLRNHYKIIKILGHGNFGDTYLAIDQDLPDSPKRVVKHLSPKELDISSFPTIQRLFNLEAKCLYHLGQAHDQIPQLYGHFEQQGQFYLVQEFVDGQNLAEELTLGKYQTEAEVIELLAEILSILAHVHQQNVIHRDIKPQNIMRRSSDGKLVLIDFGAVKEINLIKTDGDGQTSLTVSIGSSGYMPNEQANGRPKLSSDVYAVGMIGIRCLTGTHPSRLHEDPQTGDIQWQGRVNVSPALADVICKMTRNNFSQRYFSATEALAALRTAFPNPTSKPQQSLPSKQSPLKTSVQSSPNISPVTVDKTELLEPPSSFDLPVPSSTRRRLLTLLAFGGVGLGSALVWDRIRQISQKSSNTVPEPKQEPLLESSEQVPSPLETPRPFPRGASLEHFNFIVVRVDPQGNVIEKEQKEAHFFTEALGGGVGLDMVYIPGGSFEMGAPKEQLYRDDNEGPLHQVNIPPFFMGRYTITQSQWQIISTLEKEGLELELEPSIFTGANRPVENVSWYEVTEFCVRLSKQTGKEYRLPSEAEWEYACRAGTKTPFYFGETITPELVNYKGTSSYGSGPGGKFRKATVEVGSFPPNAFGLYDMHGNVYDWCQDLWHGDNYLGAPQDGQAWIDAADSHHRVRRGGSWDDDPGVCRSTNRGSFKPEDRDNGIGFRVVISA